MSSTFETIANIIAETCDIPRDSITPKVMPLTIWASTAWISSISHSPSTRPSGSSSRSSSGPRKSPTASHHRPVFCPEELGRSHRRARGRQRGL